MGQEPSLIETAAQALQAFDKGSVVDALDIIRRYPYTPAQLEVAGDVGAELDAIVEQYFYMLRLVVDNGLTYNTADIAARFRRLCVKLVYIDLERLNQPFGAARRFQRLRPEETLETLVSDYLAEADRLSTDAASLTDPRRRRTLERLATDIFDRLWTAEEIGDGVVRLIDSLLTDNTINQGHRVLWAHALGLNVIINPRPLDRHNTAGGAFVLLSGLLGTKTPVCLAALTWLTLVALYRKGESRDDIVRQIVKHDAIYDVLSVLSSDFMMDIDFKNLAGMFQGMTPGTIPDPASLTPDQLKGVEYVSQCATRGDDIFRNVFGVNRANPFFATIANWFLPFDIEHSALAEVTDGLGVAIADNLAAIPGIVDGDKYAMLLSMLSMPSAYRSQAITAMVDGMARFTGDGMLDAVRRTDSLRLQVAAQVHMVSRFLRTSPWKDTFATRIEKFVSIFLPYAFLDFDRVEGLAEEMLQRHVPGETIRIIENLGAADEISDNLADLYVRALGEIRSMGFSHYAEAVMARCGSKSPDILCMLYSGNPEPSSELVEMLSDSLDDNPDHRGLVRAVAGMELDDGNIKKSLQIIEHYLYLVEKPDIDILRLYAKALLYAARPDETVRVYENNGLAKGDIYDDAPYLAALWLTGQQRKAIKLFNDMPEDGFPETKFEYFPEFVADVVRDTPGLSDNPRTASLVAFIDATRYSDGINGFKL